MPESRSFTIGINFITSGLDKITNSFLALNGLLANNLNNSLSNTSGSINAMGQESEQSAKKLNGVADSEQKLTSTSQGLNRNLRETAGSFGLITFAAGQFITITTQSISQLTKFQTEAVNVAEELDLQIRRIQIASGVAYETISKDLFAISNEVGVSADEAVEAFRKLVFAGLDYQTAVEALAQGLRVAVVSNEDFVTVVKLAVAAMNVFGKSAAEMPGIFNAIYVAAQRSPAAVSELANSLDYVGPIAATLGIDLNQLVAVITALSQRGIEGSMAGTSLRRVLTEIAEGSKEMMDALHSAGITMYQGTQIINGQTVSAQELEQVMTDSKITITGLTGQQKELSYYQAIAKEEVDRYNIAISEQQKVIDSLNKEINNHQKTLDALNNSYKVVEDSIASLNAETAKYQGQLDDATYRQQKLSKELENSLKYAPAWAKTVYSAVLTGQQSIEEAQKKLGGAFTTPGSLLQLKSQLDLATKQRDIYQETIDRLENQRRHQEAILNVIKEQNADITSTHQQIIGILNDEIILREDEIEKLQEMGQTANDVYSNIGTQLDIINDKINIQKEAYDLALTTLQKYPFEMKNAIDLVWDWSSAIQQMAKDGEKSVSQVVAELSKLFGLRGVQAISALFDMNRILQSTDVSVGQLRQETEGLMQEMESGGLTANNALILTNSLYAKLNTITNQLQKTQLSQGETGVRLIKAQTEGQQQMLGITNKLSRALPGVFEWFQKWTPALNSVSSLLRDITFAMMILNRTQGMLTLSTMASTTATTAQAGAFIGVGTAVGVFSKALTTVNITGLLGKMSASFKMLGIEIAQVGYTLLTTPIGWILMGITAAVVGFTLAWKNDWFGIQEKVKAGFEEISKVLNDLGVIFGKLWEIIKNFFAGVGSAISSFFSSVTDKLTGWYNDLPDWLKKIIQLFIDALNPAKNLVEAAQQGITTIGNLADSIKVSDIEEELTNPTKLWAKSLETVSKEIPYLKDSLLDLGKVTLSPEMTQGILMLGGQEMLSQVEKIGKRYAESWEEGRQQIMADYEQKNKEGYLKTDKERMEYLINAENNLKTQLTKIWSPAFLSIGPSEAFKKDEIEFTETLAKYEVALNNNKQVFVNYNEFLSKEGNKLSKIWDTAPIQNYLTQLNNGEKVSEETFSKFVYYVTTGDKSIIDDTNATLVLMATAWDTNLSQLPEYAKKYFESTTEYVNNTASQLAKAFKLSPDIFKGVKTFADIGKILEQNGISSEKFSQALLNDENALTKMAQTLGISTDILKEYLNETYASITAEELSAKAKKERDEAYAEGNKILADSVKKSAGLNVEEKKLSETYKNTYPQLQNYGKELSWLKFQQQQGIITNEDYIQSVKNISTDVLALSEASKVAGESAEEAEQRFSDFNKILLSASEEGLNVFTKALEEINSLFAETESNANNMIGQIDEMMTNGQNVKPLMNSIIAGINDDAWPYFVDILKQYPQLMAEFGDNVLLVMSGINPLTSNVSDLTKAFEENQVALEVLVEGYKAGAPWAEEMMNKMFPSLSKRTTTNILSQTMEGLSGALKNTSLDPLSKGLEKVNNSFKENLVSSEEMKKTLMEIAKIDPFTAERIFAEKIAPTLTIGERRDWQQELSNTITETVNMLPDIKETLKSVDNTLKDINVEAKTFLQLLIDSGKLSDEQKKNAENVLNLMNETSMTENEMAKNVSTKIGKTPAEQEALYNTLIKKIEEEKKPLDQIIAKNYKILGIKEEQLSNIYDQIDANDTFWKTLKTAQSENPELITPEMISEVMTNRLLGKSQEALVAGLPEQLSNAINTFYSNYDNSLMKENVYDVVNSAGNMLQTTIVGAWGLALTSVKNEQLKQFMTDFGNILFPVAEGFWSVFKDFGITTLSSLIEQQWPNLSENILAGLGKVESKTNDISKKFNGINIADIISGAGKVLQGGTVVNQEFNVDGIKIDNLENFVNQLKNGLFKLFDQAAKNISSKGA